MGILEKLLRNTPDSYDDYVKGCLFLAKEYGIETKLIEYLKTNEDASTSEVIEAIDRLAGVNSMPLEIID